PRRADRRGDRGPSARGSLSPGGARRAGAPRIHVRVDQEAALDPDRSRAAQVPGAARAGRAARRTGSLRLLRLVLIAALAVPVHPQDPSPPSGIPDLTSPPAEGPEP